MHARSWREHRETPAYDTRNQSIYAELARAPTKKDMSRPVARDAMLYIVYSISHVSNVYLCVPVYVIHAYPKHSVIVRS